MAHRPVLCATILLHFSFALLLNHASAIPVPEAYVAETTPQQE